MIRIPKWWLSVAALGCFVGGTLALQPPAAPAAPAGKQPESKPASPAKAETPAKPANTATTPVDRKEPWWKERNELINKRTAEQAAKEGGAQVLFIGDSITQGWENEGKAVWEAHFAALNAANLGIGGDRTQHVLWRLDNGALAPFKPPAPQPKAAVLMIGTNNSNGNDNTAEEIASGIESILIRLKASLPQTKVLLLAIFPRGEKPNAQREKIDKVNGLISKMADGQHVVYADIGEKFMNKDGTISKDIMPDFLHLSQKGYQIWADALQEQLAPLMKETKP